MSRNNNLKYQEGFTDEIEAELEKHQIMGVPITRKVSLRILCFAACCVVAVGGGLGAMIAKKEEPSTNSLTESSTNSLTKEERYLYLSELLEPLVGIKITDNTTSEYKALEWIAQTDPAKMAVDSP